MYHESWYQDDIKVRWKVNTHEIQQSWITWQPKLEGKEDNITFGWLCHFALQHPRHNKNKARIVWKFLALLAVRCPMKQSTRGTRTGTLSAPLENTHASCPDEPLLPHPASSRSLLNMYCVLAVVVISLSWFVAFAFPQRSVAVAVIAFILFSLLGSSASTLRAQLSTLFFNFNFCSLGFNISYLELLNSNSRSQ